MSGRNTWYHLMSIVGSEHLSLGSATNMMSCRNTWYHPHVECQVGGVVIDIGNKFDVGLEHLVSPHVYRWVGTIVIGISNKFEVGSEHLSSGSATYLMSGQNSSDHPHFLCRVGEIVNGISNKFGVMDSPFTLFQIIA